MGPLAVFAACLLAVDGWEVRTILVPTEQPPPERQGQPLAFFRDARLVAVAACRSAFVWEAATGKLVTRLHLTGDGTTYLAFTADGRQIAVADVQATDVRRYDVSTGEASPPADVGAFAFSPGVPRHQRAVAQSVVAIESADFRTDLSVVAVLEAVGTADAQNLLAVLATGVDGSRMTAEAKAALARLEKPVGKKLPDR